MLWHNSRKPSIGNTTIAARQIADSILDTRSGPARALGIPLVVIANTTRGVRVGHSGRVHIDPRLRLSIISEYARSATSQLLQKRDRLLQLEWRRITRV